MNEVCNRVTTLAAGYRIFRDHNPMTLFEGENKWMISRYTQRIPPGKLTSAGYFPCVQIDNNSPVFMKTNFVTKR